MGYRSDVAFVVPDSAPRFEEMDKHVFDVHEKGGYRLYVVEQIKWYPDDEIVQAVTQYMDKLDKLCDDNQRYRFLRFGEEKDHIEDRGYLYDNPFNLCWTRRILFDVL